MPNLQKKIAEQFIDALRHEDRFHEDKIERINQILTSGKKPKSDEFWQVFRASNEGDAL